LKKILYIVGTSPDEERESLLLTDPSSRDDVSVVLIHDGIKRKSIPFSRVFTFIDNVSSEKSVSPFPSVSYQDLLRMIFEADTVAVL
jgi:hypothetical protein